MDGSNTEMIRQAWTDSGKVYGYRKLHDDLCDQGETCSENRLARLASLVGIAAQVGYKRPPLVDMAARQQWLLTIRWTGSLMSTRQTPFG